MKKFLAVLSLLALLLLAVPEEAYSFYQGSQDTEATTTSSSKKPAGLTKILQQQFIEGGPTYMAPILFSLIIGLAIAIEKIITLNLQTVNKSKLLNQVDAALQAGNVSEAIEISKSTKGPVASVLYQGLDRVNEGLDVVEKSISSYGSVLASRLESGLSWLSLFIAIAPMLGFMGTVIGMIQAFQSIAEAGDVQIQLIAGDINVALLTTVFGLITAIILQIFYNYILSKIDGLVNDMEDASVSLMDMLVKYKIGRQ